MNTRTTAVIVALIIVIGAIIIYFGNKKITTATAATTTPSGTTTGNVITTIPLPAPQTQTVTGFTILGGGASADAQTTQRTTSTLPTAFSFG